MTVNLGLILQDYLKTQVIDAAKIEFIDLKRWIESLPQGISQDEALQSFDAFLWSSGLEPFDLRSERIKFATTLMSILLLGAILGVFILTQISQRTHTQFQEASRQLSIRQFYTRRFVYAAAHDLRAPLRGIEQLSAWARDDLENGETESPNRYMALINSRIQHLSRLIEGILDLARLDNRENKTDQLPVNNAIEAAANLYRSPKITVETTYGAPNMVIHYEYDGLVRVLNNLLANAVSHHDQEEITIAVRTSYQADNLRIEVEDDGPGVPEGRHEMIFELFRTYSGNKEHTGVGMGLAMVRRLIEEWGGTIVVESPAKEGRGARFVILIPLDLVWKRAP
jgi:signal transduction histidine kinase